MNILLKENRKGDFCFDVFDKDYRNGNYKVGTVELFVDETYWLNYIEVFYDCKRKGYGVAIIKHLVKNYKPFKLSLSSKSFHYSIKGSNDKRYLTSDGLHLAKTSFENGVISRQNFGFPSPDKLCSYEAYPFLDYNIPNILNFINTFILKTTNK